ncbi:MAG: ATP-binding protein [Lachnospiraceae bacterium]|nr:ATP-binding protein [Lachnospiraceae bacterium]
MAKKFNVTGNCRPENHYMVDITNRLQAIETMVDSGDYFTINRGRQYGKTTTLHLLADYLQEKNVVASIDFQNLDSSEFSNVSSFVEAFAREFYLSIKTDSVLPGNILQTLQKFAAGEVPRVSLRKLFLSLSECCSLSDRPIILIIDEVDAASDFQVFLDFLSQLRSGYLNRDAAPTFQSVILAGVQDIRNIKQKLRSESEHQANSPWNVASRFTVDMSFSPSDIVSMLQEYEADHATGMDITSIANLIYEYTSGYPVLVSGICKYIDEEIAGTDTFPDLTAAWTAQGVVEAVGHIYDESNMLFESLQDKLNRYPELHDMLYSLLMDGKPVMYNRYDPAIQSALMYGFIRIENKTVVVANRIFETQLFDDQLQL